MSSERPAERSARLVRWALEEGFDRAGVAALGPSEHAEALTAWLARGDHAGMAYLERRGEERRDPRRLFEGARTALCVARQYQPAAGREPVGEVWPRVARYARGRDYHGFMEQGLERLAERIVAAYPGTRWRRYVDTGPVLERELAARAGLGAIGKNTNLLHPEGGSYFLLGELFLSLELAPGPPLADLCGSCTRCLEACPTGALPEPYRLDANRCISYWTIEHRGAIPEELRAAVGEWLFGCDVCQEVCPWNEAPRPAAGPELEVPEARRALGIADLLALDRERYLELFRDSPLKRARLGGLKRNGALVAAARPERHREALTVALADPDPLCRRHAAWAVGRSGAAWARRLLEGALAGERDAAVRSELSAALAAAARASSG